MAPFNNRQIGYIQAIAGRQQHVSLMSGAHDERLSSDDATIGTAYVPRTLQNVKGTGINSFTNDLTKTLLLYTWHLDAPELGFDCRNEHANNKLESADFSSLQNVMRGMGYSKSLNVFDCGIHSVTHNDSGVSGQPWTTGSLVPSTVRATPDGFLNSTHIKFRFTLPTEIFNFANEEHYSRNVNPMQNPHYEFRWIVWRSKRPTFSHDAQSLGVSSAQAGDGIGGVHSNLQQIRDGCSLRNPGYDLFMGQTGRKRGLIGYTLHTDLDKDKIHASGSQIDGTVPGDEAYCGRRWNGSAWVNGAGQLSQTQPTNEVSMTVDDLMTIPINKTDYVVMKDVRFFLGKEHGKSHFEDTLHWDWNDPIDTQNGNVLSSPTLNDKNYRWHMTLIGTNGGKEVPVELLSSVRWTTKMESG